MIGVRPTTIPPVKIWAAMGAAFVAFELYLLGKWVAGPEFVRVPTGPSTPPTWMKVAINVSQVLGVLVVVCLLYWLVARPWFKNRQITFDGALCIALLLVSVYDPVSEYLQNWFGYNSYFLNRGSAVTGIPGWLSFHSPGRAPAWPIIFWPAVYVGLLAPVVLGCGVMRRMRSRRPGLSNLSLMGITYVFSVAVFAVIETFYLRLGFYAESGFAIFGGHYYQIPVHNLIFAGCIFTGLVSLRFFTNDKGESLVERGGTDTGGPVKTSVTRLLAIIGGVFTVFFVGYHIPQAFIAGANSPSWPRDIQSRSYFTERVCGPDTDRACPGPDVPLPRPGSPYLDPSGRLLKVPAGSDRP